MGLRSMVFPFRDFRIYFNNSDLWYSPQGIASCHFINGKSVLHDQSLDVDVSRISHTDVYFFLHPRMLSRPSRGSRHPHQRQYYCRMVKRHVTRQLIIIGKGPNGLWIVKNSGVAYWIHCRFTVDLISFRNLALVFTARRGRM